MLFVKTAPRRLSAAVTAGALSAVILTSLALPAQAAPAPSLAPAVVRTAADALYTVKSGDSLWTIASSHGVSLASVFAANNMGMSTIIHPGQTIKLSGTAPAATPAPAAAALSAASYVVKAGDTLSRIASAHGVSLAAVFAANNMGMSTIIYPGQTIKLGTAAAPAPAAKPAPALTIQIGPAPAPVAAPVVKPSGNYVVKAGDTLSRIAGANGVSLATVLAANGMSMSTIIYPGQSIKLTGAPVAAPAPAAPAAPAPAPVPSSSASVKQLVADTARSMGVDVSLALAIAEQESGFRQNVVSSAGAIGTMQVMPTSGTWASDLIGRPLNLNNAQDNVTAGVAIIRALVRSSPSLDITIASYYQGQYSVLNRGMYEDTKVYVAQVLKRQATFK